MNTKDRICDCGAHFVPVENIVFQFQLDDGATEVLRLDKDGMIYKGERVLDAGQAYAAFTNWLKQANAASLALQERRQEQRRSKTDNDLAELYARRDKDRRAAPIAAGQSSDTLGATVIREDNAPVPVALAWFNGDSFALNALIKKGADDE